MLSIDVTSDWNFINNQLLSKVGKFGKDSDNNWIIIESGEWSDNFLPPMTIEKSQFIKSNVSTFMWNKIGSELARNLNSADISTSILSQNVRCLVVSKSGDDPYWSFNNTSVIPTTNKITFNYQENFRIPEDALLDTDDINLLLEEYYRTQLPETKELLIQEFEKPLKIIFGSLIEKLFNSFNPITWKSDTISNSVKIDEVTYTALNTYTYNCILGDPEISFNLNKEFNKLFRANYDPINPPSSPINDYNMMVNGMIKGTEISIRIPLSNMTYTWSWSGDSSGSETHDILIDSINLEVKFV